MNEERTAKYSALEISRYIINYYNHKKVEISNLKLQKVLYFIQGNFYKTLGVPCFNDDMYAWKYGPVIPAIYSEYKCYGSNNIPKIETIIDYETKKGEYFLSKINFDSITMSDQILIDEILDLCSEYSAIELYQITHSQAPWILADKNGKNEIITKTSIKEYFINAE